MNLDIEIQVLGGTDKMIRFNLLVSGQLAGELNMLREDFTKIAERLFVGTFFCRKSIKTTAALSDAALKTP